MLSYEEACRLVTAPGTPFETVEQEVMGVPRTLFRHAPNSLRDIVVGAAARGDVTFLVYEDERWSFDRFGREVAGLAAALVDRYGIRKGDRVAVAMRNYPEWIVSYAAAVSVGAISVSFNAWWTPDEMDFALRDCGASILIADEERRILEQAMAGLSERQRGAIALFHMEGLSGEESAHAMNLSAKAFESLLGRARATLRENVQKIQNTGRSA